MNIFNIFRKPKTGLAVLNDYAVLKGSSYPCEKCKIESKYCLKLHFANTTICVAPKDKVTTYGRKKYRKPVSKI